MKFVFANWKMYLDFDESCILASQLREVDFNAEELSLAVFPNYLAVREVGQILADSEIAVGAQNCAWVPKGAYTGAVSALLMKSVGCDYVLVGHSERRHIFGEHDTDVRKKVEACLDVGLVPVVCIGETKEEREAGEREYRLKKQLFKAFDKLEIDGGQVMVAYEPIWAITPGDPCLPAEAAEIHDWIRFELKQYIEKPVPILYGGSVNAENVVSYLSRDAVDGVLVGNASSKFETLLPIIEAAGRE